MTARTAIRKLLGPRGPFAVSRRIWTIIVDSLDRQFWIWAWTDRREKMGKVSEFKANAAAAVLSVARIVRIVAAMLGDSKDLIFRSLRPAVFRDGLILALVATGKASLDVASGNVGLKHSGLAPAFAAEQPFDVRFASRGDSPDSRQRREPLACNVSFFPLLRHEVIAA